MTISEVERLSHSVEQHEFVATCERCKTNIEEGYYESYSNALRAFTRDLEREGWRIVDGALVCYDCLENEGNDEDTDASAL